MNSISSTCSLQVFVMASASGRLGAVYRWLACWRVRLHSGMLL
jgi:hypothetical protein